MVFLVRRLAHTTRCLFVAQLPAHVSHTDAQPNLQELFCF